MLHFQSGGIIARTVLVLCLMLSCPYLEAGSGGHGDAQKGQQTSMLLTVASAVSFGIAAYNYAQQNYPMGAFWTAAGIAELIGAMAAQSNNAQTVEDTKSEDSPSAGAGSSASFDAGNFDLGPDFRDNCTRASNCSCVGPDCRAGIVNLPPLDSIKDSVRLAFETDPSAFQGKSLEQALNELDSSYNNAKETLDKYNSAVAAGGAGNNSLLGDSGNVHGVDGKGDGLDDPKKKGSGQGEYISGSGATDAADIAKVLANLPNQKRDEPRAVVRRGGLILEDARSGRLLTIFERVSRAVRGDRNRDLTLAKLEWARKELAKRNKSPEGKNKTLASAKSTPAAP